LRAAECAELLGLFIKMCSFLFQLCPLVLLTPAKIMEPAFRISVANPTASKYLRDAFSFFSLSLSLEKLRSFKSPDIPSLYAGGGNNASKHITPIY
jgi:hypothetical protein